jgi:sporulation protein YlmC with PRC-barrel domain
MPSASPIDDVSDLPGKAVFDQVGNKLGEVKQIYSKDGDPMWVTIEASTGLASDRLVFIPIARLKEEEGEIRVPYSSQHITESPEIEPVDELSEEDDRSLRAYYSVGIGDGELRTDNEDSYASRVPDGDGPVKKDSDVEGSATEHSSEE